MLIGAVLETQWLQSKKTRSYLWEMFESEKCTASKTPLDLARARLITLGGRTNCTPFTVASVDLLLFPGSLFTFCWRDGNISKAETRQTKHSD